MKFKKILEYLLYIFVFLLPLQTRWIIFDPQINGTAWEYGRISLYSFDVVFITLLLYYSITLLLKKNYPAKFHNGAGELRITSYGLRISIISLFLYLSISVFFIADNKLIAAYWSMRIIQGILFVWLILKIDFSKIKLAWAFVTGITLSAILGIYQFLTQSAFASKWLGLAYHSATVFGDNIVETAGGRWLRAYGGFPHPNILAGFCAVAIIFCLWLFSKNQESKKTLQLRSGQARKQILLNILLITYYLLLITALFFTFSRSAWIVFIILLLYYFITLLLKKNYGLRITDYGLLIIIPLLLFIILSAIYQPLINTRLQSTARLEIKSNVERFSGYKESWQMIKNHSILGVGIGNYTNELQKMRPGKPAWNYQPVHNVYLLIFSELGIVGVIIITLFLYYFFISSLKELRITRLPSPNGEAHGGQVNYELKFMFLCFYVFMFLCFFDHYFWTLPSAFLLVWTIIGLSAKNNSIYDKKQTN